MCWRRAQTHGVAAVNPMKGPTSGSARTLAHMAKGSRVSVEEEKVRSRLSEFFEWNDRVFRDSQSRLKWKVEDGSSINQDDGAASPFLMSSHLLSQMHTAVEHIDAFSRLLRGESGVMHLHADYTLIRSAIECAGMAHWALMPGERSERVRRILRIAMRDASDSTKVLADPQVRAELIERRKERITRVAEREGLELSGCIAGYTTTSVLTEVSRRVKSEPLFAWQLCSGMAHGKQWALQALSDIEELERVDGIVTQRLTARTDHLLVACYSYVEIMRQLLPVFDGRRRVGHP